jgi:uncharacterized protein
MSIETARRIIDFAFETAREERRIDFGFFGGEPLLEFDLVRSITDLIAEHPSYGEHDIRISIVTNGTILNDTIIEYLRKHGIAYQLSCDGIPSVHDANRRFISGAPTSSVVEKNLRRAIAALPVILVNAVYGPSTHTHLAESVDYFSELGVQHQIFNPDYSAVWTHQDLENLRISYAAVGELYVQYHNEGRPRFISIIDEKISIIMRGGYQPFEKCSMGRGEYAFSPQGNIFPCERLVGDGEAGAHCIGSIFDPYTLNRGKCSPKGAACINPECADCGVADFCMNWCGCSNYFATGSYFRANKFICQSEKAAIETALDALQKIDPSTIENFKDHYAGAALSTSIAKEVAKQ